MKRYISKFIEEENNSLSELTDSAIPEKLVEFILKNPFPKDKDQLHRFAEEELKIDPDKLEQYVYAFLTVILTGGASKGIYYNKDTEQMAIGEKIESEHVNLATDNKVIKKIELLLKHKIANDHLQEKDTYYTSSINFMDELKQEGK